MEEHQSYEGVENNGDNKRDQVEQADVSKKHGHVHGGGSRKLKITFGNLYGILLENWL